VSKVLLTGGSGFIGKRLTTTLTERGYDVVGTSSRLTSTDLVQCNILDPEAVCELVNATEPDIVIHCAAISSVVWNQGIDYYATNVIGTENLLNAVARLKKRTRFVFASTAGVYGNQPAEFLSETMHALPVHHYGVSKFAAEQLVRNFADRLNFTIVRPFNIIGPAQSRTFIVPKVITAFAQEQTAIFLGNIDVFRDYIEVGTACDLLAELLTCDESVGEIVNICSGKSTSLRELLNTMQKLAGYEIAVNQSADFMRSSEVWRLVGDRSKLDRLVGRKIAFKPLEDVLGEMLEAYRSDIRNVA
jgi:nucleoside-diphosphate-sugar epimerase